MKKLYFIRHGLSEANKAEIWSGHSDTPLSDEGRAQAKAAGQKAKDLHIDLIVCSPLSRAKETAEIVAGEIGYPKDKIIVADILKERNWGDLEGQSHHVLSDSTDIDTISNIETSHQLLKRSEAALRSLENLDAENILVVSHGTFGRALRHHILEDAPFMNRSSSKELRLPNGEIICWI